MITLLIIIIALLTFIAFPGVKRELKVILIIIGLMWAFGTIRQAYQESQPPQPEQTARDRS